MASRALLGVLLFGGSFVVGLAGTWAWITSTPGGEGAGAAPPITADSPAPSEEKGLVATAIIPAEAPDAPPVAPEPSSVKAEAPANNPAPAAPVDAPIQAPAPAPPTPAPAPAEVELAAVAGSAQPVVASNSAQIQAKKAPWMNLIGKRCSVSLDSVGFRSLSIREGELVSGAQVDWERDFGANARTHLLRANRDTAVDVLGIGLDESGSPRVAHVRSVKSGKTGVISLLVEDKRVPLVILDGDR